MTWYLDWLQASSWFWRTRFSQWNGSVEPESQSPPRSRSALHGTVQSVRPCFGKCACIHFNMQTWSGSRRSKWFFEFFFLESNQKKWSKGNVGRRDRAAVRTRSFESIERPRLWSIRSSPSQTRQTARQSKASWQKRHLTDWNRRRPSSNKRLTWTKMTTTKQSTRSNRGRQTGQIARMQRSTKSTSIGNQIRLCIKKYGTIQTLLSLKILENKTIENICE